MFQAIEEVAEQIQTSPPPRRPQPPPPADDDELPRRRRSREDDDAVEEDRPRPRRRAAADDDEDDEPRSRRRGRDKDDDDDRPRARRGRDEDDEDDEEDYRANRKEARRRARGAAIWFILAGIVTLVMITLSLASNFYIMFAVARMQGPQAAGRVAGLLGCGVVVIVGAIYHFMAASALKSLDGKGKIVTSIVFGFVLGTLFGIGLLVNIALVSQVPPGFITVLVFLAMFLGGAASFFNFFAAIRGIVALNNRAISRALRGR